MSELKVIEGTGKSILPGLNAMLIGDSGSGKTYSLCRLAELGLNLRIIFTEPGMETVAQYFKDRGKPIPDNVHWKYIQPASPDWTAIIDSANKINTLPFKALAEMSDINKKMYREFIDVVTALSHFVSDRDGSDFGAADDWGTDTVLAVDSLSGLNLGAMNLVVGSKPAKSMADWGVAMDNLERLLNKLSTGLRCHYILTAHLERETDETTGGTSLMASTLGKKMAPRLPRFFSDVIHTKREGDKFLWSTATSSVTLKTRNLPIKADLRPDFEQLIESWKKNGGVIES